MPEWNSKIVRSIRYTKRREIYTGFQKKRKTVYMKEDKKNIKHVNHRLPDILSKGQPTKLVILLQSWLAITKPITCAKSTQVPFKFASGFHKTTHYRFPFPTRFLYGGYNLRFTISVENREEPWCLVRAAPSGGSRLITPMLTDKTSHREEKGSKIPPVRQNWRQFRGSLTSNLLLNPKRTKSTGEHILHIILQYFG